MGVNPLPASGFIIPMPTILIANIIPAKTLSSRPAARLLEPAVSEAAHALTDQTLTFDLRHKRAMAPSFFDELIRIIAENSAPLNNQLPQIQLINIPSQPSSKFHAVCRSHRLTLTQPTPGHWIISKP